MSKKFKFGILFLVFVGIISAVFWSEQGESYSVETVVDSVWSEFMVQSSEIGEYENPSDGEPAIFIDVYDKNDIPRVEKYLQDNLSKNDLNKYEIVVFSNKGITY
ncbi:hypothetical protein GGQ92_002289 [Gracilibacillus halotolerans]|uniref:Uncharacterized protein n=1 Tax=Gracilibacillus halotolerans TaxID=74386 RepID=A0A841RNM5_9BACI|nr:hypothetical protein [Gracilibacillus halotolerans]MBB6513477.1 hypothetical protein [Gracilibacillus halotolerans]